MSSLIKDTFGSATAITITLASLATSSVGVGRQGTLVDNTSNRYPIVLLHVKVKLGTSPTANTGVYVYLIRSNNDGSPILTDAAGASDAGLTVTNAKCIGVLRTGSSPSTGTTLTGDFKIHNPGPKWTIAIVHDTGAALDSTGANHAVTFNGVTPEAQ